MDKTLKKGLIAIAGVLVVLGGVFSFLTADILDDGSKSIWDKLVEQRQEDETTEPAAEIVIDGYELA